MEIPINQLPGMSSLVKDYYFRYSKVSEFFNGDFRDVAVFQNQAEQVTERKLDRDRLTAILKAQNQNFGCGPETIGNINKIAQQGANVVVTGQQVGLFSGPLYTIYKSLTVIKMAKFLEKKCQGSFVPVFWMASDDHDIDEINHINLIDKNNQVKKIIASSLPTKHKIPAAKIVLNAEIKNCIQQLRDQTHETEFKSQVLDDLSAAYQPGRSIGEAFARWMTQLFKSFGLIFIDAVIPDFKEFGKKVFFHEIAENSPSTERAIETSKKLSRSKYHAQIQLHEGILNVFFAEEERQTIQFREGFFNIKGKNQKFTKDELLTLVENKTFIFSPNVLLRPIYQDYLLPTVAYVGGPGEIAYFAQMKEVYKNFSLQMPVIYPRKSITIKENKIDHILTNYSLQIQDLWHPTDRMINEILKKQIPDAIDTALGQTMSHLAQDFKSIRKEISLLEPTLENSADLTERKISQQFNRLEKKILQAAKKKHNIILQQFHKAKNNLYPHNHIQERGLNITPFLIKYGYSLINKLYEEIDINTYDHQIICL